MSKKMHGKGITRTLFVVTLVGLVLFALGGVALAAPPTTIGDVGQSGPTVPKLGDPVAVQHEVQWVTVTITSIPASGTFTLAGSAGIPVVPPVVNPQNSVRDALNAVGVFGANAVAVVGGPTSGDYTASGALTGGTDGSYYYRVMWTGSAYNGVDVPTMSTSDAGTGGTAVVTVDPYRNGQTFTGRVQPHGGYSATTDYCLQCHTVHNAPGEGYSLLADNSVTATCKTCHTIGVAISGLTPPDDMTAINPGFPGVEAPTSERGSYEVTGGAALAEHTLGASAAGTPFSTITQINDAGWSYGGFNAAGWTANQGPAGPGAVDENNGGLYCGSCHTPHGDFGQLVNSERAGFRTTADEIAAGATEGSLSDVDTWTEGAPIYAGRNLRYLHRDVSVNAAGESAWTACTAAAPAAAANALDTGCAYLTAADTEGESAYTYGYKLLTAYPNHQYGSPESWGMDSSNHDGSRWCGACHDEATPSEYGGTYHNHPTGCTACHGNPNDGTSTDFPHTSTFQSLLKDYPDLLCINCHTAGSLP